MIALDQVFTSQVISFNETTECSMLRIVADWYECLHSYYECIVVSIEYCIEIDCIYDFNCQ
jgi:hypothetical protein